MDQYQDYKQYDIYVPDDDINYFMWSMVAYAVSTVSNYYFNEVNSQIEKCKVKHKDGGDYIATANVFREPENPEEDEKYQVCGSMGRISEERTAESWSISTSFDTRKFGWEDNWDEDCGYLHMYMSGKMPKTEAVLDKYVRMYDRGLLAERDGRDVVNVVVAKEKLGENGQLTGWWDTRLRQSVPSLPESLLTYINEKCQEKVSIAKPYYPEHMHVFLKYFHHMSINCAMVLDELQNNGVLKSLTDNQKKGVNQIVFSDILP